MGFKVAPSLRSFVVFSLSWALSGSALSSLALPSSLVAAPLE